MLELATAAANVLGAILQVGAGALALALTVRHVRRNIAVSTESPSEADGE